MLGEAQENLIILKDDSCAWTPQTNFESVGREAPVDNECFGIWQLGQVPRLRYPGLGTLTTSNPDVQAIGSWARYLGLGTLAQVP